MVCELERLSRECDDSFYSISVTYDGAVVLWLVVAQEIYFVSGSHTFEMRTISRPA